MSQSEDERDRYFSMMERDLGQRGEQRLRHQMAFLYRDVNFVGKTVFDIGGGTGTHSLYAAASGASYVLAIEPESDGGSKGMLARFDARREALGYRNVEARDCTVQDLGDTSNGFDIILIQDAINHLNEPACIDLHENASSRRAYLDLFQKIAGYAKTGAHLIFSDCSSKNFFPAMGLINPFDPTLEWHKHQPPEVWLDLLKEIGFRSVSLRWSSPARFGRIGQMLFGNAQSAFFFTSHFVATMRYLDATPE